MRIRQREIPAVFLRMDEKRNADDSVRIRHKKCGSNMAVKI